MLHFKQGKFKKDFLLVQNFGKACFYVFLITQKGHFGNFNFVKGPILGI